ncbi:MAG: ribosome-associated translation inhibitor RaiA [Candidatus Parcubacteria bacterium]|nr:ribosome-associated translation inhibitor RaiA [Candidatus Parcubacteria bacterium]
MKIIIKTKNLELTDALQVFIENKFGGLKKFINVLKREDEVGKTLAEVFVEVEKETKHHNKGLVFLVNTKVVLPGRSLIAEAREDDLYKAIVSAKDELKMEIGKYKFKKIDKTRRAQRKSKSELDM